MSPPQTPRRPPRWLPLVLLAAIGCGGQTGSNRSPTADEAPERHEQARQETDAFLDRARAAELKAMRGRPAP